MDFVRQRHHARVPGSPRWLVLLGALLLPGLAPGPASASIVPQPAPAARDTVPGESLSLFTPELWQRLRDQADRWTEREARVVRYAERYRISRDLSRAILESARAEGVDPDLAFRLVYVESRFHARARGPAGALGLTQLMPSTARWMDPSLRTPAQIMDQDRNLRLGFRYLRRMIEDFNGDVRLGLLAYNRGPVAVRKALRHGKDPENGYSRKVFRAGGGAYQGQGLLNR